jgi:hypothetical protein
METLHIPATRNTPCIRFLPEQAAFQVVGNSIPENAGSFYAPVVQWLDQHLAELPDGCAFAFSLPYFNSSSLKALYMVLMVVKKGLDQGKGFSVTWYVEENDDFMTEAGETYKDMLGMEINLVPGHLEL